MMVMLMAMMMVSCWNSLLLRIGISWHWMKVEAVYDGNWMLIEGKTKLNSIADAERCDNFKLQMNFMFFLHLSVAVACPVRSHNFNLWLAHILPADGDYYLIPPLFFWNKVTTKYNCWPIKICDEPINHSWWDRMSSQKIVMGFLLLWVGLRVAWKIVFVKMWNTWNFVLVKTHMVFCSKINQYFVK